MPAISPAQLKRSNSFDRFTSRVFGGGEKPASSKPTSSPSGWQGPFEKDNNTQSNGDGGAPSAPSGGVVTKQLLFILLTRGPNGLGLELDATNTVVNLVKGGAAEKQGYFKVRHVNVEDKPSRPLLAGRQRRAPGGGVRLQSYSEQPAFAPHSINGRAKEALAIRPHDRLLLPLWTGWRHDCERRRDPAATKVATERDGPEEGCV